MTLDTFQLGEPVEHRGIVVTPLFPRQDPVAVYITLDEALPIGVSCVEQGRWHRRSAAFSSSDHISHSHLRRRKAQMLAAQPLARGAAQGEVWDEVHEKQTRMRVDSNT